MFKIKKKSIAIVLLVILVTIAAAGCTTQTEEVPKDIVAKVNGESISLEDFNKNFKIVERSYNQYYGDKIWSQEIGDKTFLQIVKEQIVEKLVTEEMLTQKAKDLDITIDKEKIDQMYTDFNAQLEGNEELKKFYEENGIDEAFIKKQMEMELYVEEFRERVFDEAGLNDEAKVEEMLKDYTVEVKASHILIKDEKTATGVLDRVKKGENFADLAKEFSEDPGSKENGGDLGYFGRGVMVAPFEQAAFSLQEGEVSELVQSDFGYHIIKVEDIKTYEDLKAETTDEQQLEGQKATLINTIMENKFAEKIEELKKEVEIEKFEQNIN